MIKKRILSLWVLVGWLLSVGAGMQAYAFQTAGEITVQSQSLAENGFLAQAPPFRVYISPSPQYYNKYPDGQTEEDYMRQIADQMVLYLEEYGIDSVVAPASKDVPQKEWGTILQQRAKEASSADCDLYLSLHSNASREQPAGQNQGAYIYYQTHMPMSRYWAQIVQKNYIYPDSDRIKLANNQSFTEMNTPDMPALLVQTAFHDNANDADWLVNNKKRIAANLSYSIAEYRKQYYGVPIREITDPDLMVPFPVR